MGDPTNSLSVFVLIQLLAEQGWISLRQMATLLGYSNPSGVYYRQKTRNRIPVVKMGGTDRVYVDTVLDVLENNPGRKLEEAVATLYISMYHTARAEYLRKQKRGEFV